MGYYQKREKNGRVVQTGTLVIDKTFFGMRIKKNTGTSDKNVYQEIKVALAHLKKEQEIDAFIALQSGAIDCLGIREWYVNKDTRDKPWKMSGKVLSQDMNTWLETSNDIKERTKESYKYHVKMVCNKTSKYGDTLSSLPKIVEEYKKEYKDKMVMFNRFRSTCMSFVGHYPNGRETEVYKAIVSIKPYKKKDKKVATRYNPFTPLEIDNLFSGGKHNDVKQLIYWLCLTGLRPEEYLYHGFKNLDNTIEIYGDKTSGSYARLVPKFFKDYDPQPDTLNLTEWKLRKLFEKHCPGHTPRDTRRTFAIWCQEAGIERNHITSYMGHIPTQLDDYQRQDISKNWASKDRKKLEDYITTSRKEIPDIDDSKVKLPSSIETLGETAEKYSIQQIKDIINEWLASNHPKHIRRLYKVEKLVSE